MIDSVRNTVLSIISKDNRGYITPTEFNLFAKQAQTEIFEKYMYDYSTAIQKQNARMHGSGYAGVVDKLEEAIDIFRVPLGLTYNGTPDKFYIPGTEPSPSEPSYKLFDLYYNDDTEIDFVTDAQAKRLNRSNLTAPTVEYPVYTVDSEGIKVYPTTIVANVSANYIRYPKDPKWTWVTLTAGEPIFNQGANDYQDFELPLSDETNLVVKILQYAGISIREADIVQAAKSDEMQDKQEKI
jgi:hypothetical protein